MKQALITLAINLSDKDKETHSIFSAYARKYGLDFHVIDQSKFNLRPNWFKKRRVQYHVEKFQLYSYFDTYERILFLDSDILISPVAPNLFDLVPASEFGVVYEEGELNSWKMREELANLEKRLGELKSEPKPYFNSGVMVMSKSHQELFKFDRKSFISGRWPEQTLLNYRVLKNGIAVRALTADFNFNLENNSSWLDSEVRRGASIIHYAGPKAKPFLFEDLRHFKKGWEIDG